MITTSNQKLNSPNYQGLRFALDKIDIIITIHRLHKLELVQATDFFV